MYPILTLEKLLLKRVTGTGLAIEKPCWLFSVIGNSYADTYSTLILINGFNVTEPKFYDLSGSKYGSHIISFKRPIYFSKGIWVKFHKNGYSLLLQYGLCY